MDSTKRWLVPCLTALTLFAGASTAQAAKSVYPTDPNARTLDAGPAGYTGSTSSEGLCVPLLLCPVVSNSYESSGGVNNTGHLRTRLGSLLGVGATSIGTYEGPTFTYQGVENEEADRLAVKIARRADVAALLQVTGNSATYSVDLIAVSGGASISVVNRESLAGLSDYAEQSVNLDPGSLSIGGQYRIRITTRFESGVQVVPGGTVDFDNIRVQAKRKLGGGGGNGNGGNNGNDGNNGNNGGNGNGNGNGGNGANGADGRFGGNGVVAGAVMKGDRLIVKVKCKRKPAGRCRLNLQGRLTKRGPVVTNRRTVRVRSGAKRKVALDVKSGYVSKLVARKRVVIRQTVRKNGKTTKGFVKVPVKLG